jgi:hypothetical protein
MPIIFESAPQTEFDVNAPIQVPSGSSKVSLGKLRGIEGSVGLALLRIAESLVVPRLKILDVTAKTIKPCWWPHEAPKERIFSGKA